jgi:WhiB family redox-sensing transcriptional regulator
VNTVTRRNAEVWTDQAACRGIDPEVFFPSDGAGVLTALAICERCPVKAPCLEYALDNGIEHGVFGGVSERGRQRLRRTRRIESRT